MSKACLVCGASFHRKPGRSQAQWDNQTCCSRRCANTVKARKQERLTFGESISQQRRAADAWEAERRRQDRADLRRPDPVGITCRVTARPKVRQFVSGVCVDCGDTFTVVRGWWHGSQRCKRCTTKRWKCGDPLGRAQLYGVDYEPIEPEAIFDRDGWTCQLCRSKVRPWTPGTIDLLAATIDHIVPMARGGGHLESNVQCACWSCNVRKGAGAANDQLRLAA